MDDLPVEGVPFAAPATPTDGLDGMSDPPTPHRTREARVDRATAIRTELEDSPLAIGWMIDVLVRKGYIVLPPVAQGAPAMAWCEQHQTNHPRADLCGM